VKAELRSLDDGTVTITVETESYLEAQLLKVFFAQTYRAQTPAAVLKLGFTTAQFIPRDRVDPAEQSE